jgi:hypothetical protein
VALGFVGTFLGILIGGHLYGRYLGSFNSTATDNMITELRSQVQREN